MKKFVVQKPWGNFEQFCQNENCTVKIITLNPGEELSLQYHNHRDEFWKIILGQATIVIGEQTKESKEGDEFFIPKKVKHRIRTTDCTVKVLEISFGEFDEDDIIRLKDKYNRA
jgi:mannose-6-phosphate isomerase-like protein (cupin superfamily)